MTHPRLGLGFPVDVIIVAKALDEPVPNVIK
jgi:hypothetical protein